MNLEELAMDYYDARPLPWRTWSPNPVGTKLQEETKELVDALSAWNDWLATRDDAPEVDYTLRWDHTTNLHGDIANEIADVAITLAWIAHCHGVDIEQAIINKTEKDRGRSVKDTITT